MARIVVDPAHTDGYNQGVCEGYYEGNQMLILGTFLAEELTARGADVILTRTTGSENPSLTQRGIMAENADLFISVHSDANEINPDMRGVTSFYSVRIPESESLAAAIGEAAAEAMGINFIGTIARESASNPGSDYYGVIRSSVEAGAKNSFLIEHGFHTNQEDCELLSDENVLRRIAIAEADVIQRFLNFGNCFCGVIYTVQDQDSLFSISEKFNTTWQAIVEANDLIAPYTIFIGDELLIPVKSSEEVSYIVRDNDTLLTIGKETGVPWHEICAANNISEPYILDVGMELIIPSNSCQYTYTVKTGDSLYSIGQKFGVGWLEITKVNGVTEPFIIWEGQQLIIPLPQA